jgi:hypothetical protein
VRFRRITLPGYANVGQIRRGYFGALTTCAIRNPGQSWDIQADFEQLQSNQGCAIVTDAPVTSLGVTLHD